LLLLPLRSIVVYVAVPERKERRRRVACVQPAPDILSVVQSARGTPVHKWGPAAREITWLAAGGTRLCTNIGTVVRARVRTVRTRDCFFANGPGDIRTAAVRALSGICNYDGDGITVVSHMNATIASGRKRTRAATDRADADGNTATDRNDKGQRPRVISAPYPEMPASRHHHHHQHQQHHVQVVTSTAPAVVQQSVKEKQRLCTNCKNHGLRKVWKKHKRYCKYRDCPCPKCMKTAATRKNCAEQTAKRRARQEDEQRKQEFHLNPDNFQDERPIPYKSEATTPQSCNRQNMSESSQVGQSSTPKGTMSSRTSDYEDHDSSSIDIGDGCDGVVGDGDSMDVDEGVNKKDIDAGKQQLCVHYIILILCWTNHLIVVVSKIT